MYHCHPKGVMLLLLLLMLMQVMMFSVIGGRSVPLPHQIDDEGSLHRRQTCLAPGLRVSESHWLFDNKYSGTFMMSYLWQHCPLDIAIHFKSASTSHLFISCPAQSICWCKRFDWSPQLCIEYLLLAIRSLHLIIMSTWRV